MPDPKDNETYVVTNTPEDELAGRTDIVGATTDPVKDYLKAIGKVPLLEAAQEVEISKDIEAGLMARYIRNLRVRDEKTPDEVALLDRWKEASDDELTWLDDNGANEKNHMLEANLRLVVSIAKRYVGRGMLFLDLIEEGNIGLIRGVEKFDYTKGYKFSTYATWWIRQNITRAMADQARTIRIPVHMHEVLSKMERISREKELELGRPATPEELAIELDMTPEKIKEIRKYGRETVSLDSPLGDGGGRGRGQSESNFGDLIVDTDAFDAFDSAQFHDLQRALEDVLETLDEREAGVIRMRYGLEDGVPKKLDEIGEVYDVTRERIRQIQVETMAKLRHPSRSRLLWDYLE